MRPILIAVSLCLCLAPLKGETLEQLAQDFFTWRARFQPSSGDDIPRVIRPPDWVPHFSPQDLASREQERKSFVSRLEQIHPSQTDRAEKVDYLLVRSAISRVHWELNVLQLPLRNPDFYNHQTLGALYELLLIQGSFSPERMRQLIGVINSFPETLTHAQANLVDPVQPFAAMALQTLANAPGQLKETARALKKQSPAEFHPLLDQAVARAASALSQYEAWLKDRYPSMNPRFSPGRDAYIYFLENVALIPFSPEELLRRGQQEWYRAVAFETFSQGRNRDLPQQELFPDIQAQIRGEAEDERAIRSFLEEKNIMTVPDWLQHYRNAPIPDYIQPLSHMGVVDDLTAPDRLHMDAVSYIPDPSPDLSYFRLACARDPRPIIVHEGVPGHFFQLARSWRNPRPIRRQYFDSGANEGIGFYVEEMLLQYGLFDNRPRTLEIIYNFMRLRALRVEVDIRLALGSFDIQSAAAYLASTVPMDQETATQEAAFFAAFPGQAITYQIGKIQILEFLARARLREGKAFDIRKFHDSLMINGNLPIALQAWEYLEEPNLPFPLPEQKQ